MGHLPVNILLGPHGVSKSGRDVSRHGLRVLILGESHGLYSGLTYSILGALTYSILGESHVLYSGLASRTLF
jgi:hypothetical protein